MRAPLLAVVGLALAVSAAACGSSSSTASPAPSAPKAAKLTFGQTVQLSKAQADDGYVSAAVLSFQDHVPNALSNQPADNGYVLAYADVRICAGSKGADADNPKVFVAIPFNIGLNSGDGEGMLQNFPTRAPAAPFIGNQAEKLAPHQCVTGTAPFEHVTGTTVTRVGWGDQEAPAYTWTGPGTS